MEIASEQIAARQEGYISTRITRVVGVLGVLFVLYQCVGYITWMFSPAFATAPHGDSPISPAVLAGVRSAQLTQIFGAAAWTLFMVASWLKYRRLTWPIAVSIAWVSVFWQDPLVNILHHDFSYNSYFFNKGDWGSHLPLLSHHENMLLQPILLEGLVFYWQIPIYALLTYGLMAGIRKGLGIQNRWVLAAIGWAVLMIADFLLESIGLRSHLFAWNHVSRALSLHAGTPGQWPLYEGIAVAAAWGSCSILHLFRGGNRFTPFDGAITEEGPFSGLWRVLVLIGFLNLVFLGYNAVLVLSGGFDPVTFDVPSWLNGGAGH